MKKKTYKQPKMKVVEIDQTEIICASTQNESYEEGSTDGWYN